MEKKEEIQEEEQVKKSTLENEDKQLMWFFIVVGIIFAAVLIPYFYIESTKTFEYGKADWQIENYEDLKIFHGRFKSLSGANLNFNVFLRNDPRKNDIPTEGTFDKFKYGGIVSISPEVDECRGELSRVMLDLASFLSQGVGVGPVEAGSTDASIAKQSSRRFARCNTVSDRTLIVVELGEESKIIQNESHQYCYTIYAKNCEDSKVVEKFILETIENFRQPEGEA